MHIRNNLLCLAVLLTSFSINAQQLNLPRKSPKASISYTIGFTEITIIYSAPAVEGRKVWGDLLPFGEIWRAGANETTSIEFNNDVQIEGQPIPKGKYAFFLIPSPCGSESTAIFNKDWDQWGAYGYDESLDVLRVKVRSICGQPPVERLEYSISNQGFDHGIIRLAWDDAEVQINVQTDAIQQSLAKIEDALIHGEADQKWAIYAQGADFLLSAGGDLDKALEWINESVTLKADQSWNWWIKAQVQAKQGDIKGAIASGEQAQTVGMANEGDRFYNAMRATMDKVISDWKNQM